MESRVGAVSRSTSRSCQGMVGNSSVEEEREDIHRAGRRTPEWMIERQYCLSAVVEGRGDRWISGHEDEQ